MSNILIQRKHNGLEDIFVENYASNVIDINIDPRYKLDTALDTLQNIANLTIAPDGAYWKPVDIRSIRSTYDDVKICHVDNFICCIRFNLTTYRNRIGYFIDLSFDGGKTWTSEPSQLTRLGEIIKEGSLSITDMSCASTYLGYEIMVSYSYIAEADYEESFYYQRNGFIRIVYLHDKTLYNISNYEFPRDINKYLTYTKSTPRGFLLSRPQQNYSTPSIKFNICDYLYTNEQIDNPSVASWGNFYSIGDKTLNYAIGSFDGCYYDEMNGLLMLVVGDNFDPTETWRVYYSNSFSGYFNEIDTIERSDEQSYTSSVTALHRAFYIINNRIVKYISNNNGVKQVASATSLPTGYSWKYFCGNYYRLYAISENGDIAYLNDVNGEWRIANQNMSHSGLGKLNWFAPISNAIFVTDAENTYIVGAIVKNGMIKFIRADVGTLK